MRRAAKVDSTAKDLVYAARQMGAKVMPLNVVVDALVLHKGRVFVVDWKTPHGTRNPKLVRTHAQMALEAEGWPIHYISDVEGLAAMLGAK